MGDDLFPPLIHLDDREAEYRAYLFGQDMELLEKARAFAHLTENRFGYGPFRIGLDAIIGLLLGHLFCNIGDFLMHIAAFYMVFLGVKLRLPWWKLLGMTCHIFADWIIGMLHLPILHSGDLMDVFYKANSANLVILERHVHQYWHVDGGPKLPPPNPPRR